MKKPVKRALYLENYPALFARFGYNPRMRNVRNGNIYVLGTYDRNGEFWVMNLSKCEKEKAAVAHLLEDFVPDLEATA